MSNELAYRPDIDGLRAIAVLSVLVFHYAPEGLAAGFIGVDIFFVISGYLITGILAKSFANRTYSILDFYQRRVRRIFPAMILVLAFCLVVGWFLLFPGEYAQLGKYVAAAAGFVENLVLWQEAGYFDQEAVLKPLLHFWSLAVEEQFYIVWPLLLWLVMWRRLPLLLTVTVIAVLSFLLNLWVLSHDAMAAFYLPLSRAWELMAGAWLAVAHRRQLPWLSKGVDLQAWLGVLLLVIGLVVIRAERGFPGWWGLFPVVGTALLINAGMAAWFNRRVLTWKPAVWVGLISYPLYLWHWTLWSLAIVVFDGTPYRHTAKTLAVVLAIPLAWLTYRYLEQPVRRRGGRTALVLALVVALLGIAGYVIQIQEGVPSRGGSGFQEQRSVLQRYTGSKVLTPLKAQCFDLFEGEDFPRGWSCTLGDVRASRWILVYGDSHAMALLSAFDRFGKETGFRIVQGSMAGCLPLRGVEVEFNGVACEKLGRHAEALAISERPSLVVIVNRWAQNTGGKFRKDDIRAMRRAGVADMPFAKSRQENAVLLEEGLIATLSLFREAGLPVLLMRDNPQQKVNLPLGVLRLEATDAALNASAVTVVEVAEDQARTNAILDRVAKAFDKVRIFDPDPALCRDGICPWAMDGEFLYHDRDHLSVAGSMRVYPLLRQAMEAAMAPAGKD